MSFYQLFNYENDDWMSFSSRLSEYEFQSLSDFKKFMSADLKTIDNLLDVFSESKLIDVFNNVRKYSLRLPELIPSGKITRLASDHPFIDFNRSQVLCILCHMFLCSLKKTVKNFYWTTFENWLNDGRTCATVYLHTLIEYFQQSFVLIENKEFMNESVSFKRNKTNIVKMNYLLQELNVELGKVSLKLNGGIGDESMNEVDFANCDIGFGVTGTQEEILFGASPEMCIAMLFCDTMQDDEAIVIKGARQVAFFDGYGLNLRFKSLVPLDLKVWQNRRIIAVDSIDFSAFADSFEMQIEKQNLERELKKAFAGYSEISNESIDTGHWGCGAFCGNRYIKSVIQLVASSITHNRLVYFCHGDAVFYENFNSFLNFLYDEKVSAKKLWNSLNTKLNEKENIFNQIVQNLNKK